VFGVHPNQIHSWKQLINSEVGKFDVAR
jgi:uncharacterized protein YjcR